MKEKIETFILKIKQKETKSVALLAGSIVAIVVVGSTLLHFKSGDGDALAISVQSATIDPIVATVGEENSLIVGSASNNSWPAEIISSDISQVQPQRQGTIVEWRVRVGERVTAGQILGKISAPPATPELIKMLAEQTESVAKARAQIRVIEEYNKKEQQRLSSLKTSLENSSSGSDPFFSSLLRLREKKDNNYVVIVSFLERSMSSHTKLVSNAVDWRYFKQGSLDRSFGSYSQSLQGEYEQALIKLVNSLKNPDQTTLDIAKSYFSLAVRFSNNSVNEDRMNEFKTMVAADQNEFLELLGEYKDSGVELAEKETEYKIMISEKSAMLEKDTSMAYAEADAAESAYKTVSGEITGGAYITAPRSGVVSAVYKKVGDLVDPEMSIALIANEKSNSLTVRMRIPSNIRKPSSGDILSVIRPGFPNDARKARVIGVGASLDASGSYMADAVLIDPTDWPIGSSVRVLVPFTSESPVVKMSAVVWDENGLPSVWAISSADRLYLKKLKLGRTIGDFMEIYEGMIKGDRYIANPTPEIKEDMFLSDIVKKVEESATPSTESGKTGHEGHENMEGM